MAKTTTKTKISSLIICKEDILGHLLHFYGKLGCPSIDKKYKAPKCPAATSLFGLIKVPPKFFDPVVRFKNFHVHNKQTFLSISQSDWIL